MERNGVRLKIGDEELVTAHMVIHGPSHCGVIGNWEWANEFVGKIAQGKALHVKVGIYQHGPQTFTFEIAG